MTGAFGRMQRWLLAAWVVPFLAFVVLVFIVPEPKLEPGATKRTELRVYSKTTFYRELEKPAEFGLEKLASVVNYLLLASAGVLAFMIKGLTEFRAARVQGDAIPAVGRPRRGQLLLFLHAGIACFFSLTCGVTAYLSLVDIGVVQTFALTGHLSECVVGQIIGLLFAILLLLVAMANEIRTLLP
jgi:hypothetical protein